MDIKADRILDCTGLYCPEPVYRTRLELDKMAVGQVLEVLANDPAAEEDIKILVKRTGHELITVNRRNDRLQFLIRRVK